MAMCTLEEQATWYARALAEWDEWEGPHELRALFCRRFKPKHGIIAYTRKAESESDATDQPVSSATHWQFEVITGRDADGNQMKASGGWKSPSRNDVSRHKDTSTLPR